MKGLIIIKTIIATSIIATGTLTISSISFPSNGFIPSKYTCDGDNLSPAFHFKDLPKEALSLAIIMHDPDAQRDGGFTHWVVWNINPLPDIPENFKGGDQGINDAQKLGYTGPCPPTGTHHYHFKVYALDTILKLDKKADRTVLENAMKGHILAKGEIVGLYKKIKPE